MSDGRSKNLEKSDGRSMACTEYLQKDLVDLNDSCMKVG